MPALARNSARIENGPGGAGHTNRSLTHSLDLSKEGLAMNATQSIDLRDFNLDYIRSRIAEPDARGCQEWTGGKSTAGYGYASRGRGMSKVPAHRVVYTMLVGPIPAGLVIDHLCRNRACVAAAHLEAVTTRENNLRGYGASGNHARQTTCKRGHPFDETNTYIERKRGARQCRACSRLHDKTRPSGWARQRTAATKKENTNV